VILVDTSVWIDHLHKAVPMLVDGLEAEDVATHPFVIGEIACGEIARRQGSAGPSLHASLQHAGD
jgi:predicted nucleic acid-binding protein